MKPFANEPVLELRRAPNRDALLDAMRQLDARLPLEVPLVIGDDTGGAPATTFDSVDPGAPARVVAVADRATEADARRAVDAAQEALPAWRAPPWRQRAEILVRAADLMRTRRLELAAL